jgi:pilus assembly protein CpaB
MSSIAAGANPERTNRWLLIGAAALAVLAGVLIFVALNAASDDSGSKSTKATGGNETVLVAKNTVDANTRLTADMFDTVSVPQSIMVVNPVSNTTSIVGTVTRNQILKGQQLSFDQIGQSLGQQEDQIAFSITEGWRGFAVPVSASQIVAGLIVPDDRVDVIMTYTEKRGDQDITRVETILQNIRVLALAQTTVENQPTLNAQGTPIAQDPTKTLGMRPNDVKPDPSAGTATLELTPDQVQQLTAAMAKGNLSLALRGVGDDKPVQMTPYYQNQFGVLPQAPNP